MSPNHWLLLLCGMFLLTTLMTWAVFLRPAATLATVGVITDTLGRAGGTHWQQPVGLDRGFRTPTPIAIADSVVLVIRAEGLGEPLRASVNTVAAERFSVGQRVRVEYQRRGLWPVWSRTYVLNVTPVDAPERASVT